MRVYRVVVGILQTNCYIVCEHEGREAVVVDPGGNAGPILSRLQRLNLRPKQIISTHGHFDHVLGVDELRSATGAKFLIHTRDLPILEAMQERTRTFLGIEVPPPPRVDGFVEGGSEVAVDEVKLKVIHTPGHSPGSICLYTQGTLLSGDTLFSGSIGRTDTAGGNYEQILASIRSKIMLLPDETTVYPGHGPSTTIGKERSANPFIREALSKTSDS